MQNDKNTIAPSLYRGDPIPGSYVFFRLPGKTEKSLISGTAFLLVDGLTLIPEREGFVMAPFPGSSPVLWLDAGITTSVPSGDGSDNLIFPDLTSLPGNSLLTAVTEEEYKKQVGDIRKMIQDGAAGKVVLSRQMPVDLDKDFDLQRFFNLLCEQYPDAFVYLACIPGYGCWAGASPETLLRFRNGTLSTMALAGTRKSGEKGGWGEKDVAEHNFVVDFIEMQLKRAGCNEIRKSKTCSVNAGKVMHLCTDFSAECRPDHLAAIVGALHPTPAVCGWPAEKALDIIQRTEKHERTYYTGYLGPVGADTTDLFVNLRCIQLFREKAIVYTGGGLTAGSDPQKEWDETVLKSTTMLSAMEKMRNLAV
ncbi:MAG: isochorismate synthase [Bacteroidales bacterium]|nr:isochorismate synthase [Bacteroidales bacterium]